MVYTSGKSKWKCLNLTHHFFVYNPWLNNDNENNNNNKFQRFNLRFFFYNLLTALQTVSSMYAQVARAQSCANHMQHKECSSHATCRVSCHVMQRDSLSYYVWQSLNHIYFSFILLAEPFSRWRRGGNRSTRRIPLAMSIRKCYILQPEHSSAVWESNPYNNIGGRLGKQAW